MKLIRMPIAIIRLVVSNTLLAVSQIWANKVRSMLTALGIIIGIGSITSVIAVLDSMRNVVLSDLESLGTNAIHMDWTWPRSGPMRNASWEALQFQPEEFDGLLEHCPSVARFSRVGIMRNVPVRRGPRGARAIIWGIEPAWHDVTGRSVILGRPFTLIENQARRPVCLITTKFRDELRLDRDCVGQQITLVGRGFMIVGLVDPPREMSFLPEWDRHEVFVPFGTSWRTFDAGLFALASSTSPEVTDEAVAELRFFLRRQRNVGPGEPDTFRVDTVQQYIDMFKQISTTISAVAAGVFGISLLVGGVGIMNIMLVSVSERTREIGLRKAVGAHGSVILLQFLIEAIVLCLLGGVLGVSLGRLITMAVGRSVPHALLRDVHMPLWAVGVGFGFAATVGIVFGMIPAIKAARLDPIDALRHP